MYILGSCGVSSPFFDVEREERFVCVGFGFLQELFEMALEVFDELVVELLAEEVGYELDKI